MKHTDFLQETEGRGGVPTIPADDLDYYEFLAQKQLRFRGEGLKVSEGDINTALFDFQALSVRAALTLGKFALFEECGLGKSPQELEWARIVAERTKGKVLIFTTLGVAGQMVREAVKFGYKARYCRSQQESESAPESIIISNYDMHPRFHGPYFAGIVLDESSILKNYTGKTKQALLQNFSRSPYLLCATATPSPNDHLELGNHAQYLGVMDSTEMIMRWFVNDSMQAGGYRLKSHGKKDFWAWVASWSVCISKPSDVGCSDEGFNLPALNIHEHTVEVDHARAHAQGRLMLGGKLSATQMWAEKRATINERCELAAGLANGNDDYWIVWAETNAESKMLREMIPGAIEVKGSDSLKAKEEKLAAFSAGEERVIVTKLGIAGFGLNWQHCRNQVFASATFSYEKWYQGLRRSWRYGVQGEVNAHAVYAESEGNIVGALQRKREAHEEMQAAMNQAMRENGIATISAPKHDLVRSLPIETVEGAGWKLHMGDCVEVASRILEEGSVDFVVYSPPFSNLYIYSDSVADMGNSASDEEFFAHYDRLMMPMARALKDGARVAVHCKDLPLYLGRDGAMGLNDFPGGLIKSHEKHGMYLERWIAIWKDPVIEMQRTKNAGLLWSSAFCERAERARQGMADYVLIFRKGVETEAAPAKAPIPRSVVRRLVDLWANPGEAVMSPYHPTSCGPVGLMIVDNMHLPLSEVKKRLMDGRNLVTRVHDARDMQPLIARMAEGRMVFHSRVALTDGTWLVVFRKWVDEMPADTHVTHDLKADEHEFIGTAGPTYWDSDRDYSIQVWQRYASPVWFDLDGLPSGHEDIWFDIQQTNVLNGRIAREAADEKHICPLQLDVIERCIKQWSESGDLVFSPFAGVGSEGYVSIKTGREFVGAELKESYWQIAQGYLAEAEFESRQPTFFDLLEKLETP